MVISCPHCGRKLRVGDDLVGQQRLCPVCKQPFSVPKTGEPFGPPPGRRPPVSPSPGVGSDRSQTAPAGPGDMEARSAPMPGPQSVRPGLPHVAEPAGRPAPPSAGVAAGTPMPRRVTPPSLPTGAGRGTTTGGPPPLPPGARAGKAPGGPPPIAGGAPDGAKHIGFAMRGLLRAASVQKIGYFVLVQMALIPVHIVFRQIFISAFNPMDGMLLEGICVATGAVLYIGLAGVLVGGLAHLSDLDDQGRSGNLSNAFGFCVSRFVPLFAGAVLLGVMVVVPLYGVNRGIFWLSEGSTAGSLLGALLFLPQFVINMVLVTAFVIGVLVPIAVAVEDIGASAAVSRLLDCVRRDTGPMFVQLAASVLIGAVISLVLGVLVFGPLVLTCGTNGSSRIEQMMVGYMALSRLDGADGLRMLAVGLIALVVGGYLSAYWVGSFTAYYRDARHRAFGTRSGAAAGMRR